MQFFLQLNPYNFSLYKKAPGGIRKPFENQQVKQILITLTRLTL